MPSFRNELISLHLADSHFKGTGELCSAKPQPHSGAPGGAQQKHFSAVEGLWRCFKNVNENDHLMQRPVQLRPAVHSFNKTVFSYKTETLLCHKEKQTQEYRALASPRNLVSLEAPLPGKDGAGVFTGSLASVSE